LSSISGFQNREFPKSLATFKSQLSGTAKESKTFTGAVKAPNKGLEARKKLWIEEMKVCRKVAYGSGSKYYGEINSKNESHGYGCFLYANGTYYEGEWRNGKRCGKGGEVYTN
jgi:hypothetical protein